MVLLRDPDELQQHANRKDPSPEVWPGEIVTREMVMASMGDQRDWFRYMHKYDAYQRYWREWTHARQVRRNFMADFEWDQILVLGDYGSGKTTIAIDFALPYFSRGHYVAFNASAMFGWRVSLNEGYTAKNRMPKASIEVWDEASAYLASRVGHGVAVSAFSEGNLNSRKQNTKVVYMSAQDWGIAANIRRECKQVWKPVPKQDLLVDEQEWDDGKRSRVDPANDPANFRLAYYVWDDFPYKKRDLIEGEDPNDTKGFGAPSYIVYHEGNQVRDAFLLNDTFQLADIGAAGIADRDEIKAQLEHDYRARQAGANGITEAMYSPTPQANEKEIRLMQIIEQNEHNPPEYFTAGEIAKELGVHPTAAGQLVTSMFPVKNVQRKGYPTAAIYEHLDNIAFETED